jgi:hypothetical protein
MRFAAYSFKYRELQTGTCFRGLPEICFSQTLLRRGESKGIQERRPGRQLSVLGSEGAC